MFHRSALYIAVENRDKELVQILLMCDKVDANLKSILKYFIFIKLKSKISIKLLIKLLNAINNLSFE